MLNLDQNRRPTKYITIRLREEIHEKLSVWRDAWDDHSLSEVLERLMSLAEREVVRNAEIKKAARNTLKTSRLARAEKVTVQKLAQDAVEAATSTG